VDAFIAKPRRERKNASLSHPRTRRKFIRTLYHFVWPDQQFLEHIPPQFQTPPDIERLLINRGAGTTCWCISTKSDLDHRQVVIGEALRTIVGYGEGTFLCCFPGKLAYFENEDVRWMLCR
jgi:hypothetical protein